MTNNRITFDSLTADIARARKDHPMTTATVPAELIRAIENLERQHAWVLNLAAEYRTLWVAAIGEGDDDAARSHNETKHRYEGRAMGLAYAITELRAIAEGH